MYLIKNNKLSILSNKLISSSNKLSILVRAILVQALIVQRYSCAPNILYYINYSIPLIDKSSRAPGKEAPKSAPSHKVLTLMGIG